MMVWERDQPFVGLLFHYNDIALCPQTTEGNGQDYVVSRDDAEVEIDWGDLTPVQATDLATGQQNGATGRRSGTESIDWDAIEAVDVSGIQLVEESVAVAGEGQASVEAEPVTHAALECVATDREGCGAGPVSCSEAELDSLLSSTKTRSLFLDDIMELRGFLSQRAQELSIERGILLGQVSGPVYRAHSALHYLKTHCSHLSSAASARVCSSRTRTALLQCWAV